MSHTLTYEVGYDNEIAVGDRVFYAKINLDVDFDDDADAQRVEVTECEIMPLDEDRVLPWTTEGKRLEKIIIEGDPELTEVVDKTLWEAISRYAEDNYGDIHREVDTDYEEQMSCWNAE
jgi:hypothetical protein